MDQEELTIPDYSPQTPMTNAEFLQKITAEIQKGMNVLYREVRSEFQRLDQELDLIKSRIDVIESR